MLGGSEQRGAVVASRRGAGGVGVLGELVEGAGDLPLGLDQQPLRVARQLAGGQQFAAGEFTQLIEARQQFIGEFGGQQAKALLQAVDALAGGAVAQGVAAREVGLDVVRHLATEALGQFQVLLHQLVGPFQGLLRPPEGDPQRQADGDQQQGDEVGEKFQAHLVLDRRLRDGQMILLFGDSPVTARPSRDAAPPGCGRRAWRGRALRPPVGTAD
ncbi:hypothetical protein D9M71_613160 [compost metagenome]